jgi:hypothetical protein
VTRVQATAGGVELALTSDELAVLAATERDLLGILSGHNGSHDDPAAHRTLFPDAYRDDPDAAAEFHALTDDDLTAGKRADAVAVITVFAEARPDGSGAPQRRGPWTRQSSGRTHTVVFMGDQLTALLRNLTDLRLLLADRLGIEHDGDRGHAGRTYAKDRAVYAWLGGLQELTVSALLPGLDAR